jgi:hypothetical protein
MEAAVLPWSQWTGILMIFFSVQWLLTTSAELSWRLLDYAPNGSFLP